MNKNFYKYDLSSNCPPPFLKISWIRPCHKIYCKITLKSLLFKIKGIRCRNILKPKCLNIFVFGNIVPLILPRVRLILYWFYKFGQLISRLEFRCLIYVHILHYTWIDVYTRVLGMRLKNSSEFDSTDKSC